MVAVGDAECAERGGTERQRDRSTIVAKHPSPTHPVVGSSLCLRRWEATKQMDGV